MNSFLRTCRDLLGKIRFYFVLGHSRWTIFFISLVQFALIFNDLLWMDLVFIPDILKHFSIFLVLFFVTYIPITTLFGFIDAKKGPYQKEVEESGEVNPIWKRMFQELHDIKLLLGELHEKK